MPMPRAYVIQMKQIGVNTVQLGFSRLRTCNCRFGIYCVDIVSLDMHNFSFVAFSGAENCDAIFFTRSVCVCSRGCVCNSTIRGLFGEGSTFILCFFFYRFMTWLLFLINMTINSVSRI